MKISHKVFVLLIPLLAAAPMFGQDISSELRWGRPATPSKGGACFYKHPNFRGDYFCLNVGQTVSSMPRGFNEKISSIRIFGRTRATIFADRGFRGKLVPFERDIADLKNLPLNDNMNKSWNDRISSIMVAVGRR